MKDALGQRIEIGSILRNRLDGAQGVVVEIAQLGKPARYGAIVGDIAIQIDIGSFRCTNIYNQWEHVPRHATTALQRYRSFMARPWTHDDAVSADRTEAYAMEFAAALLPRCPWEDDDAFPTDLETVMRQLASHIDEANQPPTPPV